MWISLPEVDSLVIILASGVSCFGEFTTIEWIIFEY